MQGTGKKPNLYKQRKILRQLKNDMIGFGRVCLPGMFTSESPDFHYELGKIFLDESIRKMCVIAPRGHAKSSIGACVFPLHHLFFSKGQKVIVLSSKTQGHAIDQLQTIKDALDHSMPLRSLFGYWGQHSAKVWTKDRIVLKDNSAIICKGTGQQVRGLKFGNQRPTLFVLDDPEDENNTKTSEAMEWNLRWLLQGVEPGLDAVKGRVLVIGTPQHESCMVELLHEMDGYKSVRYQALSDDGKTCLWPDLHPVESLLEKKKDLESINRISVFYREYQCQVVGDEDQLFAEKDLRYWDGTYEKGDERTGILNITHLNYEKLKEPIQRFVYVFTGIDPASSTKQTADFSTIVSIAIDSDDNRYILPYYRKHAKPMDLAQAILDYDDRYTPQKAHVESVGYQEMIRDYITRIRFIPGFATKLNPRTSKSYRLESLQPWFFKHKIFLKPNMTDFENELLMYPRGKHDDLLDGLYYAFYGSYKPPDKDLTIGDEHESYGVQEFDWAIL